MAEATPQLHFDKYRVKAGNFSLTCREAGEGLPVVFLETLRWGHRPFYEALARQFHLFILAFETATVEGIEEKRRAAREASPLEPDVIDAAIAKEEGAEAAVREIAKSLAGNTYSLIGSSQGANLALRTVLRAPVDPEPVEALVLIGPTAIRHDPELLELNMVGWSQRLMAHIRQQPNLAELPFGWELAPMFLPKESDAELEAWLHEVACPTLVAFGSKDRMITRDTASTYRANIPNCHISLVYDAGHLVAPERPEALANAVIDFVENRETFVVSRQRSVINP